MPFLLYMLAVAVFAQGTSEFMLAGLLPAISDDLGVSIPRAGLLTSSFAVGMVIGAPAMAVLGRRWPPRWTLTAFLGLFIAAHVVGGLTDDFAVLMATRVVAALANAGFLAVALSTVAAVVPADLRARALAVVLGGTTLALIAGVPLGAALGAGCGWRTTLWAVAVLSVPALVAVAVATPTRLGGDTGPGRPRALGAEFGVLASRPLRIVLLLAVLVNGATFCVFTYLAPLVTDTAGLDPAAVPVVLALFGVGAFAGVQVSGRFADRHWRTLLVWGGGGLFLGWGLLAVGAAHPFAVVVCAPIQGALSFAVGGTLIARVMAHATGAPTLGGSFATAALNLGALVGPVLGGIAYAGPGARGPVLAAVVLVLAALAVGAGHTRVGTRAPDVSAPEDQRG
ncbi:MFS transporter [Nocardiopsis sp. N85]|uniref:Cmx/CmrA family chloramphenicol efflux MFS transporter n=1 Tax=Nocardiopsis sp. N85 TaxID=3029400 RepID=UPI00237F4576|nr:Cmx/CmrA family chloramphenicol efflux MFS transporter [Nocardiopsis sp. N85]MDE3725113.1 MFS transporter [Nocardiopsis sp. N85]